MGYNTSFTLEVKAPPGTYIDLDTTVSVPYAMTINDLVNNDCDSMKWYDHNEDMQELSRLYPTVLFVLTGEGEDPGDMWRSYYRSGNAVNVDAEITYREPDLDVELPIDVDLVKVKAQESLEAALDVLAEAQAVVDTLKVQVDK